MSRKINILLIGPLPPPIGGARVLFKNLYDYLTQSQETKVILINTLPFRKNKIKGAFQLFKIIVFSFVFAKKANIISLHCTGTSIIFLGIPIRFIASLFRKPWIIRTFGGLNFRNQKNSPQILKILKSANAYMCETKKLAALALEDGITNSYWFSNNRQMPELPASGFEKKCSKFLYLGHIRIQKGFNELIEAGEKLAGENITIDVYGTLRHDVNLSNFTGLKVVKYCGEVEINNVIQTMQNYDALLLPSYSEGYPGVIIEAYAAGLPIIATKVGGIPEILDDTSGILIEPKNSQALYEAIIYLNNEDKIFKKLLNGVRQKRKEFDSKIWNEKFINVCKNVIKNGNQLQK